MRQTMGTIKAFADVVAGGRDAFNNWAASQLAAAAAAGATDDELRNLNDAMRAGLESSRTSSAVAFALGDGYGAIVETAYAAGAAIRQQGEAAAESGRDTGFYGQSLDDAAGILVEMGAGAAGAADDIRTLDDRWAALTANLDDRAAFLAVQDSFDQVRDAGVEAWNAAAEGAADADARPARLRNRPSSG